MKIKDPRKGPWSIPQRNQFEFPFHHVCQAEGIHEIDDAIQKRIYNAPVASDHRHTDGGALMYILVRNFRDGNIEPVAALLDEALDDFALFFERLIAVEPERYACNSDCHMNRSIGVKPDPNRASDLR